MPILLTSKHVRAIGYCVPHMRKFCDRYGFSLRSFMHDGALVDILPDDTIKVNCGGVEAVVDDAQILKLVRSIG